MIEYVMWGISFISLFLAIFWIQVIYLAEKKENLKLVDYPSVSIVIPAWNEEKGIAATIESVLGLDYPREKLEVIVVDDKSTDSTLSIIKKFKDVVVIAREKNGGTKAKPVNDALAIAKGEIFGVVDADSLVEPNSLKKMLPLFEDPKNGAIITLMKVRSPKNILQQIQHLEYIFGAFARRLMSKIETLYVTPGVLSLYRRDVIRELGGFDEHNITEDLEIAMRLKSLRYNVRMQKDAVTYTYVPETIKELWHQRLRWFRGFLYNTKKYKHLLFSRKHGALGMFQIPLNYLTIFLIVLLLFVIVLEFATTLYDNVIRFTIYRWEIFELLKIPTFKEFFTSIDIKIWFPISLAFLMSLYIYHKAHQFAGEKWRFPLALLLYITLYPSLRMIQWIVSISQELFKADKKWRGD